MKALLIVDIPDKYSIDELKADIYINHKGFNLYKRRRMKLKPLPKRHGRLIDADALKKDYPHDEDWDYPVNTNSYVVESIENAPTIIEADTGEEE